MDVDNDINELIESGQLRSGTPLRRSGVDTPTRRRSLRTRTRASADKSEQSSTVTRVTQTQTTEIRYAQAGKTSNDSDASADYSDTDSKKETSSRKSYSRRTVVNGASVSEEDTDVVTVKEVEPRNVVTSTETPIQDAGYSSDEGGKSRLTAYDIYKSVEDYWEVFPKTDYTYSRSSTDRKEISPGVINPPNMSRRSLHPRTIPSVSDLRRKSPTKLHIMKREVVKNDAASRYFTETKSDGYVSEKLKRWSAIDSDVDEVDEKFSAHKASTSASAEKKSVIVTKLITIWTYITTILTSARKSLTTASQRVNSVFRRERYVEEAHFSSIQLESEQQPSAWLRFQGLMLYWATCFQTWVVAWLLYWLHGGQDHVTSERRQRKKYLQLFLLGLLPLLILLGGGLVSYIRRSPVENFSSILERVGAVTESWLHFPQIDFRDNDEHTIHKENVKGYSFAPFDEKLIVKKVLSSSEFQKLIQSQNHLESQQAELETQLNGLEADDTRYKAALNEEQMEQQKRLMVEVDRIKMQVDNLFNEQQRIKNTQHSVHAEFNIWQKKIRDLSSRLRLLQEARIHTIKKMEQCCKKQLPAFTPLDIENHVIKFLSGLFSSEEEVINNVPEIHNWVHKLFVARDELEARLANLTVKLSDGAKEAANYSADIIMTSVSEKIREEFVRQHQDPIIGSYFSKVTEHTECDSNDGLSYSDVQKIVDRALAKYDADKTGMVDYALESSGGSILSTRCTENYQAKTAMLTIMGWFHWYPSAVSPRTVIQPGVVPGNCWAFTGGQGFLVIQLSAWIKITAFSIEHIPRSLSPTGKLDSAPRDFRVLGLKHENDEFPMEIGKYQFQENGTSLQYFKVQRPDLPPFNIVELQIQTNHGNMEYTCLYRFRVHGIRVSEKDVRR
ncbi:klaroid protein-like [Schistocerca cancellata]|uniref:klaroid protein-like n=1 Tax=Schistocerca cancellata TaxID=274614 RepID=UPI00211789CD|nr:klaroid protein-like [Schistocerca cancellata]XP_049775245.1 klaroid protein-like [Schistocerca cancellata]